MKSITFTTGEFKAEKTSAWLVSCIQFAEKLDVFSLLDQVAVKMKTIEYTVRKKLATLLLSVMVGCEYTSDINEKLVPDRIAARLLDMERFPDQSQINAVLKRMNDQNVSQLKSVHHQLFLQNSKCLSNTGPLVVDIDQSGLIANGKNYELADKGYFCKKKNQKGYQLSAAFCGGDTHETLSLYLDPGNVHCQDRLDNLVNDAISKLPDAAKEKRLIFRLDGGYGSDKNIQKLRHRVKFVTKGYSPSQAKNLAQNVKKEDWEQVDDSVDVFELPSQDDLRYILVRTLTKNGAFVYTMLVTNITASYMSEMDLFHFYNQRQTIEAFFKTCKNVYHIKNLRTKVFNGIHAFLWIVFFAHNLITWMKSTVFHESKLESAGTKTLVKKLGSIVAEVKETLKGYEIVLPDLSRLARHFVECMFPKYEQLSFGEST